MAQRDLTAAPRALRAYIDREHGGSISHFADSHGLPRAFLSRVLSGTQGQNVSLRFAHTIEQATGGAVAMSMWLRTAARRRAA